MTKPSPTIESLRAEIAHAPKLARELKPTHLLEEFDQLSDVDEQVKHTYASYGVAAYYSQCLEAALSNLALLHAKATGCVQWRHEADEFEKTFTQKTLGAMLRDVRKRVEFNESAEQTLNEALARRNQIAHGFFYKHAECAYNRRRRRKMVEELCEATGYFRAADFLIECLVKLLIEICGIPASVIDEEFRKLRDSAEPDDAISGEAPDAALVRDADGGRQQ